jgi:flagellin
MTSILTNTASMAALATLRSINNDMATTQNRISSGMRVETAADNAAYWSIATTMRSDNKALSTVQDALGLGAAKVDVAYTGMNAAIDVVSEIKAKIVAASEPGVDKAKVQKEIVELQNQLTSIAESASFNGVNWLNVDLDDADVETDQQVVGSFTRDASGAVSIQTLTYTLSADSVLFGGATTTGLLDTESSTTGAGTYDFTVSTLDISTATLDADDIADILSFVDEQLQTMTDSAANLGALNKRISMQEDFVANLMDSIDSGVGRLVDADMNEESTRLKALQTQQQLGIQALSIANSSSENILALFR